MKKNHLKKLALLGITGGVVVATQVEGATQYGQPRSNPNPYQGQYQNQYQDPYQSQYQDSYQNQYQDPYQSQSQNPYQRNYISQGNGTAQQAPQRQMTQADLLKVLDPDTRKMYESMPQEYKDMALKMANQTCKGRNECKGLNSCKSDANACAGEGGCKGKSKCSFKDKNEAVKTAHKAMERKRGSMQQGMMQNRGMQNRGTQNPADSYNTPTKPTDDGYGPSSYSPQQYRYDNYSR